MDLVSEKAFVYKDDQSGSFEKGDVPAELQERVATLRDELPGWVPPAT